MGREAGQGPDLGEELKVCRVFLITDFEDDERENERRDKAMVPPELGDGAESTEFNFQRS